ncbi:hypothetical protein FRB93_005076 [Tulasnella sp. JGI-2019a]|nr:hypothetical protein FRB93_005076 [Tulasnella sp. JGI-2019a]
MFATRSNSSLFLLTAAFLAAGAASAQTQNQCVNTCINQIVSNQDSGCTIHDSECVCSDNGFQPCLTQQCQGQDDPASAYCNEAPVDEQSDNGETTTSTPATATRWGTTTTWTTPATIFTGTGITASSYYSVSSMSSMSTASVASASRSSTSASASASHRSDATAAIQIGGGYAGALAVAVGALGVIVGGFMVA